MYLVVSTCAAAQLFSVSEAVQALPGRVLLCCSLPHSSPSVFSPSESPRTRYCIRSLVTLPPLTRCLIRLLSVHCRIGHRDRGQ